MNNAFCGTLTIVGTPIGNLEDISFRALRILKEADLIAAEDTRHSVKLLNHFDIHTRMVAYHKFNEAAESEKLCALLQAGKNIALISDAGMPVISDPGYMLVRRCHAEKIPVTVVPGPNAAICGIVLSGLDCRQFTFIGFLEKSGKELTKGIDQIVSSKIPTVLYESPHRLPRTLALLTEKIPDRSIRVVREITKQYEEIQGGTITEMAAYYETHTPKGEFVLIIDGRSEDEGSAAFSAADYLCQLTLEAHLAHYMNLGQTEKEAMKAVAKDRGISKREVYQIVKVRAPETFRVND